jgi:AraC-like DNA-binding protein
MDALARLLDGPRGRDAFLLRVLLEPPWSVRLADESPLGLVAMVRGSACFVACDGSAVRLGPGDVMVAKGPEPVLLAHDPAEPPHVTILPGMRCTAPDGRDLAAEMDLGPRTWGNDPAGSTEILIGCYQVRGEASQRLLAAMPEVMRVPAPDLDSPLVRILAAELVKDSPGQSAVLDRLFDVLLVAALRAWITHGTTRQPGWYRAQGDAVVGAVLRLIHDQPAHPWTVAALADHAGISRSALARRFTDRVGEPPLTYLTGWRLALAADRLLESDATLEAIAREVGYSTPFALSAAFKRERGLSPTEHRHRARGGLAAV